ncbi:PREDICTED: olfactory receptor 6B1-like [Nanorana parkeri]|uniref:olfactory receptor 6B1-like n=1 Tax=Nanorana parkeri TaxID=125878 RepID=UPI0008545630|nr:PREDICTED: olfactory receptor 6B1-like [Nanorana parkeri]
MYVNQSTPSGFRILGFPGPPSMQYIFFLLLLITYLLTLLSNSVIITITLRESRLHTPMYYYLRNLSFLEICYVSVTVPKILSTLNPRGRYISFYGCMAQFLVFFSLGSTECLLFGIMAYDRYLAICKPLHYTTLMSTTMCRGLSMCAVIGGFLTTSPQIFLLFRLPFCGSDINHFFCDAPPLLQLCCGDTYVINLMDFFNASLVILTSLTVTLTSYVYIIGTIIRIQTTTGRRKTFSTCFSHLIVVSVYYSSITFMYMRPKLSSSFSLNRVLGVFYTVITPVLNPLIYCLRNTEVKEAIRNQLFKQTSKKVLQENYK